MKIHPGEKLVTEAELKLQTAIVEALRGLTQAESIHVVVGVLSKEVLGVMKYEIRMDRHGDPNKPGGLL